MKNLASYSKRHINKIPQGALEALGEWLFNDKLTAEKLNILYAYANDLTVIVMVWVSWMNVIPVYRICLIDEVWEISVDEHIDLDLLALDLLSLD